VRYIENLRRLFNRARRNAKHLLFAWEPRGDWSDSLVRQLCEELRLIHAVDPFARHAMLGLQFLEPNSSKGRS
jgi:hypothetical protein